MSAKDDLLSRLSTLRQATKIESIKDKALTEIDHNNIARLLRNGLAVVSFVALEDFLKKKTSEALSLIGSFGVNFDHLPEEIKYAATYESLSALNYQISFRTKSDKVLYVQDHATKIASTTNTAYELTQHAFGHSQANLQPTEIKRILKAFSVNDPWGQMSRMSARLGLTAFPLEGTYDSASKRRHQAAHVASASIPETDLNTFIKEAIAISITFDALISKSLSKFKSYDMNYLSGAKTILESDIRFRTIAHESNVWKEKREGSTRAIAINKDKDMLLIAAKARAAKDGDLLVVYDSSNFIVNWHCYT